MVQGRRVAVIDDESNICRVLETAFSQAGFDVRSATDPIVGLRLVREWEPDAIILDVMMPKVDGLSLLPQLRRFSEAPIVIVSARTGVSDRVEGLRRGADVYLTKPFSMDVLIARVEAALRRPELVKQNVLTRGGLRADIESRSVWRGRHHITLTTREFNLLVTFMRSPTHVFARADLFGLLWGSDSEASPKNVETYICSLRAKIDLEDGGPSVIQTVRGVGYRLGDI
jgi:DNA-binding response OmpR family regulator